MHLALIFQRVDPARGGAETYIADLCRELILAGHRIDLYAESLAADCLPPQVKFVHIAATGRNRLERIWSFAKNSAEALRESRHDCTVGFINTWGHDVLIPQGGIQAGSANANAQRFPTQPLRWLYSVARSANPKSWLYRAIEQKQYHAQRQPVVVAVSNMVKRHIEETHHVPRQQIHVVPNAIDPERLLVSQPGAVRCAFRNRLGLEPSDLVGLFAGHNFALKGLRPLLSTLAARYRRNPKARTIHLLVCGNGNLRRYRRLAHRMGLAERVHFLGFYPDIRACYHSSDFFVQPTYYDPCSLVVLEALACALPVITTAQNGASELLAQGREGFVVSSPGAQGELMAALDNMCLDTNRQAMSAAAARLGRRQTLQAHVARLISIFEHVAEVKRRGPHILTRGTRTRAPHFDHSRKRPR